jgi:hypothetical protein
MGLFGRSAQTVGFTREEIAAAYLRGEGLEVGALHLPLKLPAEARARYVDRMTVEELRRHYPELPDKQACFDRDRVTTSLEHVLKDYREGAEVSRREHYLEWARDVDKLVEPYFSAQVNGYIEQRYSIHFHNWTPVAFLELVVFVLQEGLIAAELVQFCTREVEMIVVLRRRA